MADSTIASGGQPIVETIGLVGEPPSDESLMEALARGHHEALSPLYGRYAPLVLAVATRALDRSTAEETVQEVFLAVWRGAGTFDPSRGAFRPWLMQIAQRRILNELRRRHRRPRAYDGADEIDPVDYQDPADQPPEMAWRAYQRSAIRAAVDALPRPQRDALALAFFDDLSHPQVAALLELPLGTAKTRIRAGLRTLRTALTGLLLLVAIPGAVFAGWRVVADYAEIERQDRALRLVTMSDIVPIRMSPGPGQPDDIHGWYRGRPGSSIAVVTLSRFPPAGPGSVYQAWARYGSGWVSLGTAEPGPEGRVTFIAEGDMLVARPDTLLVTREARGGALVPTGSTMIRWDAD